MIFWFLGIGVPKSNWGIEIPSKQFFLNLNSIQTKSLLSKLSKLKYFKLKVFYKNSKLKSHTTTHSLFL